MVVCLCMGRGGGRLPQAFWACLEAAQAHYRGRGPGRRQGHPWVYGWGLYLALLLRAYLRATYRETLATCQPLFPGRPCPPPSPGRGSGGWRGSGCRSPTVGARGPAAAALGPQAGAGAGGREGAAAGPVAMGGRCSVLQPWPAMTGAVRAVFTNGGRGG